MPKQTPTNHSQVDRTENEVNRLLEGNEHGSNVIDSKDLNEISSDLRTADSPSERAEAARKLGIANNREAVAHLVASLEDGAPEVRKAAVESLAQIGDPSAIVALNELLLREKSRQLPAAVIRDAINSIAVKEKRPTASGSPAVEMPVSETRAREIAVPQVPEPVKTEKPAVPGKREIFTEYLNSFVERSSLNTPLSSTATSVPAPPVSAPTSSNLDFGEAELRHEEEALRKAADALEQRRIAAEAARRNAEAEARLKAESEAQVRLEVEARLRAEEEVRQRMAEEAARQKADEEARVKAELEVRQRAAEEAQKRAEEEARFRLEAETLRKAAEELARKRAEAEAIRKQAEAEAAERARVEAARLQAEEEARVRALEEARREAEAAALARAAEDARLRAEVEAYIRAEQEAKRKAEEEAERLAEAKKIEEATRARLAEEVRLRAEEDRARQEAEERQREEDSRQGPQP